MTPAHDNETVEPLVGMMQMLLAMMLLPLMDACAKTLGSHFPVGALAWWRFTVQLALVVPILLVIRRWDFRPDIALGQMLPGIVIASATICFFQALQHMTMAKAITIVFVSPMLQTLLSALLLGERPRIRRLLALAVGFAGVLIVIRPPTNAQFELVTLLPLGTAVAFAIYTLMLRHGARYKVHPLMTCAYIGFGGSISTTIPLATSAMIGVGSGLFSFPIPSLEQIPLILAIGAFALAGHSLLVSAAARIPVSLIAPFYYFEIISSALVGYLVFNEIPDQYTIIGAAIIAASGIYLIYRERLAALKTPSPNA